MGRISKEGALVTIDASSTLKDPNNITIPPGTKGYIHAIDDTTKRLLIKFYPGKQTISLWFAFTYAATGLRALDSSYNG